MMPMHIHLATDVEVFSLIEQLRVAADRCRRTGLMYPVEVAHGGVVVLMIDVAVPQPPAAAAADDGSVDRSDRSDQTDPTDPRAPSPAVQRGA